MVPHRFSLVRPAGQGSSRDLGRMIETAIRAGQADGPIPAAANARACPLGLLCLVQGFRIAGKLG